MKICTLAPLALLACLLWPGQAQATDHPFGHCEGHRTASCTMTVAANQTIFIKESFGGSTAAPTDTFSLTYTQARCDTDSLATYCSYYAHTGASSGSVTISFNVSTGGNESVAESWDPGDVVNTGSPVDQSCFASGSMPTGTNNVSVCSIQSTQTNDIFEYQFRGSDFFNTSFGLPANGPTVQKYTGPDTFSALYVNATLGTSPITLIPSGAPSTTALSMSMTNTTSSTATFGGQLVTLKSGVTPVTRHNDSSIIKFHPSPARHRPLVLAWILPFGWPWRGRRASGWPQQRRLNVKLSAPRSGCPAEHYGIVQQAHRDPSRSPINEREWGIGNRQHVTSKVF
jgi:hypothetical protein